MLEQSNAYYEESSSSKKFVAHIVINIRNTGSYMIGGKKSDGHLFTNDEIGIVYIQNGNRNRLPNSGATVDVDYGNKFGVFLDGIASKFGGGITKTDIATAGNTYSVNNSGQYFLEISSNYEIENLWIIKASDSTETIDEAIEDATENAGEEGPESTDWKLAESATVGGTSSDGEKLANPLTNPDAYAGINQEPGITPDNISSNVKINGVLNTLSIIGAVIATVVLVFIGARYILGSVEQKAEYKNTAIAYILGAFLLAIGPQIVKILYNFARS